MFSTLPTADLEPLHAKASVSTVMAKSKSCLSVAPNGTSKQRTLQCVFEMQWVNAKWLTWQNLAITITSHCFKLSSQAGISVIWYTLGSGELLWEEIMTSPVFLKKTGLVMISSQRCSNHEMGTLPAITWLAHERGSCSVSIRTNCDGEIFN